MAKQYTVCEALDHIYDRDTGEEKRGQETEREDALKEEVNDTEYDQDQETTDVYVLTVLIKSYRSVLTMSTDVILYHYLNSLKTNVLVKLWHNVCEINKYHNMFFIVKIIHTLCFFFIQKGVVWAQAGEAYTGHK